jgi:bifunctional DNA-binding transcriptional regulator/antitoxin component of YhaV-PrlF toxin-antitoxin module
MSNHLLTLTDRGVVSIPAEIRRHWPSRRVLLVEVEGGVLIRPLPEDPIAAARGAFSHLKGLTSDQMRDEDRAADAARDDR